MGSRRVLVKRDAYIPMDRSIQKNESCNSYKTNDVKLLFRHHIVVSEQWCMRVHVASVG